MKKAILIRMPSDTKQTLGAITTQDVDGSVFVARTLELPWLDNQHDISCIPPDTYICRWTFSDHLQTWTYEITNVPNRTGIRIHSANYFFNLKGCTALGDAQKDINADAELDVIHSGDTVAKFNKIMNGEDFILEIRNV